MPIEYLALMRGINVGGNNIIPMADLRDCISGLGATDVATYIQSGNVLFDGGTETADTWTERIEAALSKRFGYEATVVVRTHTELRAVVEGAPPGFGDAPDRYRYDVLFLVDRSNASQLIAQVPARDGVDDVAVGDGVLYYWRLSARATQSHVSKLVSLPIYKRMTIRNWRTTTRLLAMLDERAMERDRGRRTVAHE